MQTYSNTIYLLFFFLFCSLNIVDSIAVLPNPQKHDKKENIPSKSTKKKQKKRKEGKDNREKGKTGYMCFLNCCVRDSIDVVPCFIVWAASGWRGVWQAERHQQKQEKKNPHQPHLTCDCQTPTARPSAEEGWSRKDLRQATAPR